MIVKCRGRGGGSLQGAGGDGGRSTGADPGFPVGGGANPPGGRQHMILPNFVKNCMKLRKFWAVGGARAGCAP